MSYIDTIARYLGSHDTTHYFVLDGKVWSSTKRHGWYGYDQVQRGETKIVGDYFLWMESLLGRIVTGRAVVRTLKDAA